MKQTFKRLQALALVLAMCVSFLQIPSFAADDDTHGGVYNVSKVSINNDGTYTITEFCENHVKGNVCNTANGAIATKVVDGKTVKDEANWKVATLKNTENTVQQSFTVTDANCINAGSIEYEVTVAGVTYNKVVTTDKATGNHTAVTAEEQKKNYAELNEDKENWELITNTATETAAGKATFAKKCSVCKKFIDTNTVTVDSPMVDGHVWVQEQVTGKDGKVETKDKVFTEEIKATTCKENGSEYRYLQCADCGDTAYYTNEEMTETSPFKAKAYKFTIKALAHTYEYTIGNEQGYVTDYVTDTNVATCLHVYAKCTVCGHKAEATVTKGVEDKTQLVKSDKCKAGSRTFAVTYNDLIDGKKSVTENVTMPYYADRNYVGVHDFGTQVTDEETAVKATCCENGHYDQVQICKVCGEKKLISTHTLFATGKHTAADAVKENVVAATYAKAGSYDLVTRCADCGEVLSSTHKTVAKLTVNKSSISKVKNVKTKKAQVTIKKASSVTGYQIQYSTSSKYKSGNKSVKTKKTSYTIKNLKKGKKYYVRVRSYKTVDGKTYYSSWSGSKTVTIKK